MSNNAQPQNIQDLPLEIIVKIATKLPYTDMKTFRMTCPLFNEAGKYVQRTALHRMKKRAEAVYDNCLQGFLTVTEGQMLRALKGTASVKCLTGIIRVADASLFNFIIDGTIYPTPPSLLEEIEKALKIASRRNPLVGRDRLKRIFSQFNKYFIRVMNNKIELKKTSFFHSVTDLLHCLPFKTCSITETHYGLQCIIYMNPITVAMSDTFVLTEPLLIQFLAKLNVRSIQEYIYVNMGNVFSDELQNVDATIDVIEVLMECTPGEREGVRSLWQVGRIEPRDFMVRLHGVCFTRPPGQRYSYSYYPIRGRELFEGEEIATYTYTTRPVCSTYYNENIFNNLV